MGVPGRILAIGGFSLGTRFDDVVLELAVRAACPLRPDRGRGPAAHGGRVLRVVRAPSGAVAPDVQPVAARRPREVVLAQDVIYVSGGNTANALAVWRVHGFDAIVREAWERGALVCGWSAGMICWYEASVTDSFGPALAGMRDGLGFLPGSACPHYDGEVRRRPVYTGLVRDGFPPGIACDDAAACSTKAPSSSRSSPASRTHGPTVSVARARSHSMRVASDPPMTAVRSRRGFRGGQRRRSNATACAARPSPRPVKPRRSVVVALHVHLLTHDPQRRRQAVAHLLAVRCRPGAPHRSRRSRR